MKDWMENLPKPEKLWLIKLFEKDSRTTFCADAWIEANPDGELKLRPCLRTPYPLNLCPYDQNSELCRF